MKVLVACEESGVVRDAFIEAGHDAVSCDLKPTRSPGPHHQHDIKRFIMNCQTYWDLIILHPDCTAMSVSGNGTYGTNNDGTPKKRHGERISAIEWTIDLWQLAKRNSDMVALENPVSVIFPSLREMGVKVAYTQPWQHGHGETKKTGFALHNLQPLTPTNIVEGREQRIWKMAPGPNRKRDRSETYSGIAKAMATQWAKQP